MKPPPIVAVALDVTSTYFRDVLAGIHRGAAELGGWRFRWTNRAHGVYGPEEDPPLDGLDGLLSTHLDPRLAAACAARGVALVGLSRRDPAGPPHRVVTDDAAVGRLAAEHLLARGFRSFGFVGLPGHEYSECRREAFARRLAAVGFPVAVLPPGAPATTAERLRPWLGALPRPLAVFAANDLRARTVVEGARDLGLAVPGDVAVLGVDDDFLQRTLSPVPLSSVQLHGEEVGRRAAYRLAELLRDAALPPGTTVVPPLGIAERRSTDVLAIDDPVLRRALAWIEDHGTGPADASAIARASGASRRGLERRFRDLLGTSPVEYLLEWRIRRARTLLVETDRPVARIAEELGFAESRTFIAHFRARTGETPGAWRRRLRGD